MFGGGAGAGGWSTGCAFLDAGKVVRSSAVDAIHLDTEAHRALGEAVAARLRLILA